MVSVRVVWQSFGAPADNQRVSITFDGMRGVAENQIADRNGDAHFNVAPGSGKVIVNGTTRHHGRIEGRVVAYI